MRVIIDTHGFLNAIPSTGDYKWLYDAFIKKDFIWVISNEILTEYTEIIGRNYGAEITSYVIDTLLNARNVIRYDPSYKWQLVTKDPDDDRNGEP
jgi:uncharacterized protein